VKHKCKINK